MIASYNTRQAGVGSFRSDVEPDLQKNYPLRGLTAVTTPLKVYPLSTPPTSI